MNSHRAGILPRHCILVLFLHMALSAIPARSGPPAPSDSGPTPAALPSEPTDEALEKYAELTGRTILRPGDLRRLPASIKPAMPTGTNDAIAFIVCELAQSQIEVIPDGELFVRVLPSGWRDSAIGKQTAQLKPPPPQNVRSNAGTCAFIKVDVHAVLPLYAEMRGRTILRPTGLRIAPITLRSQQPLTPDEVIYACHAVLVMSGLAILDDGDHFVQVVPQAAVTQATLRAPKRVPVAPLLDPRKLPSFADPSSPPAYRPPSTADRLARFYLKWIGKPLPWGSGPPQPADQLVKLYADLTDRQALPSGQFGHMQVVFTISTPLTQAEVLYAIETSLALNNLAVVPVDKNSIRAGHLSERRTAGP